MKKKLISTILALVLVLPVLLSGCGKDPKLDVEKAVTESLNRSPDDFSAMLEKGIVESSDANGFLLQFPEELKEPYLDFLHSAFALIDFHVSSVDEKEDGVYTARLAFTPVDIKKTMEPYMVTYAESMQEEDLTEAVSALFESSQAVLSDSPVYSTQRAVDFTVTRKGDSYLVSGEDILKLIEVSLENYMEPYDYICSILDTRDFFQAFLDALFKGEFAHFMGHTGKTEEEALQWYEAEDRFASPDDLAEPYRERCSAAYKNILKQCRYSIGIPIKNDGTYHYTVEVTYSPNNSLTDAWNEFSSSTYYDFDSASAAFVEILERYASSPSYGDETTTSVELNLSSFLTADETSDVYILVSQLCPIPD